MKKRGIPTIYYVAPQFWAWRQGRVRLIRDYIDKALVIFPFEEKFYRDRGVDATFVGHPLAELPHPTIERTDYAAEFHLDPARKPWITLMPGSRVKEVRMNLPTILESAALLGTITNSFSLWLRRSTASSLHTLIGRQEITLVPEALPALFHSRAGIVASGTATVEAAMMNTPFVMVYKFSPASMSRCPGRCSAGTSPRPCHLGQIGPITAAQARHLATAAARDPGTESQYIVAARRRARPRRHPHPPPPQP